MKTPQAESAPQLKPDVAARLKLVDVQAFQLKLAGLTTTVGYQHREGWDDPIVRFFRGEEQICEWNVSTGRGREIRILDNGRTTELPFMVKNTTGVVGRVFKTARLLPKGK